MWPVRAVRAHAADAVTSQHRLARGGTLSVPERMFGFMPAAPPERTLRESLLARLDLIEPGLRPFQDEEFALPNANGTRGYIDILARDRHNMWVVVELKRSTTSSRQALHEVSKYVELLSREKNLAPDRIRAIIVSTVWSELLVPVSKAARECSYDLRGYQLHLDDAGTILAAERVMLLEAPVEPRVTPIHIMYFFRTEEHRDQAWQMIRWKAGSVGADDLLAADIDYVTGPDLSPSKHGLYVAIGRINSTMAAPHLLGGYDGPEPFAQDHPAEYLALCDICNYLVQAFPNYRVIESAIPGLLPTIVNEHGWAVSGYRGSGTFSDTTAFDHTDLYRMLNGNDRGDSQIQFSGSANPTHRTRWQGFVEEAQNSLVGNPAWTALVNAWLADAAERAGDGAVFIHIFNPCDLLGALLNGWPNEIDKYLPSIVGTVNPDTGHSSLLQGALCWNGRGRGLADAVQYIYPDRYAWFARRWDGDSWIYDNLLLHHLGLRYVLLEKIGPDPYTDSLDNEHRIWLFDNDDVRMYSSHTDLKQFLDILIEIGVDQDIVSATTYLTDHADPIEPILARYR
ncbi:endonuclease NucS domain-containing protein [Nocardia gamkensis]|uniref:endonuclease NucS domain-containing protein n=1 Tax=Nocardia gamkensis TaxID=352869 RepID=UPI0033E081B1